MYKGDFIKMLKDEGDFKTGADAERFYDCFVKCMEKAILKDRQMTIPGFGPFKVVKRAERKGRNPRTGKELIISAREALTFTPSQKMKESL